MKAHLKSLIERGPVPLRLLQEIRAETHLSFARFRARFGPSRMRSARRLRRLTGVKLHYGCGSRILPGWVNVDGWNAPGIDYVCDLRQPLPLSDNSCHVIFTEHVFEHIDTQFRSRVLREFHRLLEPGGTVRIVVPDCGAYAEAYVRKDIVWFQQVFPGTADLAEGVNCVFGDHFHRFIDDFESLQHALRDAGFTRIQQCTHQGSPLESLRIDTENQGRIIQNLYVEARK